MTRFNPCHPVPQCRRVRFSISPAVGLEESLRLELHCDGYDGIHSTVVCPYYIATGMFAGIGRSLIPILTPEYVVDEAVKAIRVNQEVLYLPSILYWMMALKAIVPTKSYYWSHRAIGAANTMKTFTGRRPQQPPTKQNNLTAVVIDSQQQQQTKHDNTHLAMQMTPPDIGINVQQLEETQKLNQ